MDVVTGGKGGDGGAWMDLADLLSAYSLNVPVERESKALPCSNSQHLHVA